MQPAALPGEAIPSVIRAECCGGCEENHEWSGGAGFERRPERSLAGWQFEINGLGIKSPFTAGVGQGFAAAAIVDAECFENSRQVRKIKDPVDHAGVEIDRARCWPTGRRRCRQALDGRHLAHQGTCPIPNSFSCRAFARSSSRRMSIEFSTSSNSSLNKSPINRSVTAPLCCGNRRTNRPKLKPS